MSRDCVYLTGMQCNADCWVTATDCDWQFST